MAVLYKATRVPPFFDYTTEALTEQGFSVILEAIGGILMQYRNIVEGKFIRRPNRFIAHVEVAGREEVVHVKNTGRCRELLVSGATVFLEKSSSAARKTAYDLIAVMKGDLCINMDSQVPNQVAAEWLRKVLPEALIRREVTWGNSRFDLYIEVNGRKIFMEVKGVTLEASGVALFPDAPTLRGVKHLKELAACIQEGYEACVLFVIQMKGVREFRPHEAMHSEFGAALRAAQAAGVQVLAYDCVVAPDSIEMDRQVVVEL